MLGEFSEKVLHAQYRTVDFFSFLDEFEVFFPTQADQIYRCLIENADNSVLLGEKTGQGPWGFGGAAGDAGSRNNSRPCSAATSRANSPAPSPMQRSASNGKMINFHADSKATGNNSKATGAGESQAPSEGNGLLGKPCMHELLLQPHVNEILWNIPGLSAELSILRLSDSLQQTVGADGKEHGSFHAIVDYFLNVGRVLHLNERTSKQN